MELVDTHAHLDMPEFEADLLEVLQRAAESGVGRILCVGTTRESSLACVELARRFPGRVHASVGLHPNYSAEAAAGDMEQIRALAALPQVVAVGETGLDFHHTYAPHELQVRCFREHIRLSLASDKPLIIHVRKADEAALAILREEAHVLHGVRHCFDGSSQTAAGYLNLGLHVAFGGVITRPGHKRVKTAARTISTARLLLETDCPYMAPPEVKVGRNEPAFIVHALRALAGLRGASPDEIAAVTTRNAARLFFHET